MKSRNLVPWQLKTRNLSVTNESRNLLPWQVINQLIQPSSLNSALWGIKIIWSRADPWRTFLQWECQPFLQGKYRNGQSAFILSTNIQMASSELTSCQDFVILCGLNFTFLVMLSGCSLPERFWQMSYSLMLLQNQPKLQGWKYAHPKSDFVVRLVIIAPPPFKLKYSARNRVKRKW